MGLHFYENSDMTAEIDSGNPDTVRNAVQQGNQAVDERQIYIGSDDSTLTYENIIVETANDFDGTTTSGEIDVLYAPDNSGSAGTYSQTLDMSNQDFDPAIPIWRKVVAPDVQSAFKITDIQHQINDYKEFKK